MSQEPCGINFEVLILESLLARRNLLFYYCYPQMFLCNLLDILKLAWIDLMYFRIEFGEWCFFRYCIHPYLLCQAALCHYSSSLCTWFLCESYVVDADLWLQGASGFSMHIQRYWDWTQCGSSWQTCKSREIYLAGRQVEGEGVRDRVTRLEMNPQLCLPRQHLHGDRREAFSQLASWPL